MVSYTERKYDTTVATGAGLKTSYIYAFTGLSTDTKPVGTYMNTQIQNGSSFVEMDTGSVFMYNEDGPAWIEFGG